MASKASKCSLLLTMKSGVVIESEPRGLAEIEGAVEKLVNHSLAGYWVRLGEKVAVLSSEVAAYEIMPEEPQIAKIKRRPESQEIRHD